jgi:hypothetical protein
MKKNHRHNQENARKNEPQKPTDQHRRDREKENVIKTMT